MIIHNDDTIAAIATPIGEGGICVIRISGPKAIEIVDKGFHGSRLLSTVPTHTVHFGRFLDGEGSILDNVLATVFQSPHSYTGEEVVEISCHGGIFITKSILGQLLNYGARMAEPGEFTKRAFLNGKLDLLQAEAVADLIHSRTQAAHNISIQQLQGKLSEHIKILREDLINLLSLLELELDFTEEGLELTDKPKVLNRLSEVEEKIELMIKSYSSGKIYREGVKVALLGRPNVGKSSILNRLLETDRAIVTDIPGTTRDTIEESINIGGILFTLVDTAGLRESNDLIEMEGVKRAEKFINNADILLFIIDLSCRETSEDISLYNRLFSNHQVKDKRLIVVGNKSDLIDDKMEIARHIDSHKTSVVSAKTGSGFNELKQILYMKAVGTDNNLDSNSPIITSTRQLNSLNSSLERVKSVKDALLSNLSGEFLAPDLRLACIKLGEIIGDVTSDDVLNNIFSRFCIGK